MKAAILEAHGLEHVRIRDVPEPQAGPGEVLVRMRAASLNFRDLVTVDGGYGSRQRHSDLVLLSDGAGEIAALGEGVDEYRVGDRVITCFFQAWTGGRPTAARVGSALGALRDGIACEYRALPACGVVRAPDELNFVEAATLPCAALTAWSAVVAEARTAPGEVVVTQGTGGVSMFALQFATAAGARVIATSSSPAKLQRLQQLGAAHLVDYRELPDWGKRVVELTSGVGADLVVEVGGAQTLKQSLIATRVGGAIALIGVLSGGRAELNLGPVVTRHIRLLGVTVGNRDRLEEMLRAMSAHRIRPVIDRVFGFDDLKHALAYLRSGRHVGKVCIEI